MKNDKLSKSDAIKEFKRLFREKTGNEWEAWENKTDFHKQPNKFYPLEIVSLIFKVECDNDEQILKSY